MSISRHFVRTFTVVALLAVLAVSAASPALATVTAFTNGTPTQFTDTIQVGSRFVVNNSIIATAVGAFIPTASDRNGSLTSVDFTGLLYSVTGDPTNAANYTLIEKVLIPTGTAIDSDNFAYANFLTSHGLNAGQQYVVTAWVGVPTAASVGSYTWSEKATVNPQATDPNITRLSTEYVISSGAAGVGAPTSNNPNNNDFGGNLLLSVPEPASLGLLALGGVTVASRRRRAGH